KPIQCSQPVFHPSTSMAPIPFSAEKSTNFLAFSVVAPCFPEALSQLFLPKCISHQIPVYFVGLNQETSPSLLGSLRFRISLESISSVAFSVIKMVLQGVSKGVFLFTL